MRYRMLDVRIWCDEKFRSLTPLKPSGQALFLYLLCNPHTTSIPGLYRAGAGAMAEELGWSLIGFQRALKEVMHQGLVKADLKARVIFIDNAIKYNKPQSPNVVRSWALHWDEIPECALKNEAYYKLEAFVKGLGKAFELAFAETLRQPAVKDATKSLIKSCLNQEQDQEQKQEQDQEQEQEQEEIEGFKSPSQEHAANLTTKHPNAPSSELLLAIPLMGNAIYQVTQQECEEWQTIYAEIDVLQELCKLIAWNIANPSKRKHRASILRHIHAWLTKEQQQKKQFPAACHSFPITFEHNLQIAKKWMTSAPEVTKPQDLQLLKGKKMV